VTLDGPPEIHDRRRVLHNGLGTFARVAAGIDALLAAQIPVNLRVVVDRENLPTLPPWPDWRRNADGSTIPSRLSRRRSDATTNSSAAPAAGPRTTIRPLGTVDGIPGLAEAHPDLRRFHQPRLHGMHHLAETGEWPPATFDSCPAAKKEWPLRLTAASTLHGHRGPSGKPAGKLRAEDRTDEDAIARWRDRNVFSIRPARAVLWPPCVAAAAAPWP